jgi:queuine tRNA-ribosyltransferase
VRFELLAGDGAARRGRLSFARGSVETPAFMPVGTYGTVKAMTPEELVAGGTEMLLGNTFHLWLRPGLEIIGAHQGLHRFMHWPRPILTDSGGFQVFSLAKLRRLSEAGVKFRSPVDGAEVFLSPEVSMHIQRVLGADVAMQFDECTPYPAAEHEARASMELSLRWARRSRDAYYDEAAGAPPGVLFGIVQGGMYRALRAASWEGLAALELPGYAIGGLAVGEPEDERLRVLEETVPLMSAGRPRYLMGVGRPQDLVEAVARGIDLFDCVMPRATPATATCSPRTACSTSATRATRRNSGRSMPAAAATPAATTRAPTSGTSTGPGRSSAAVSTRSTICTSIKRLCRRSGPRSRAAATPRSGPRSTPPGPKSASRLWHNTRLRPSQRVPGKKHGSSDFDGLRAGGRQLGAVHSDAIPADRRAVHRLLLPADPPADEEGQGAPRHGRQARGR